MKNRYLRIIFALLGVVFTLAVSLAVLVIISQPGNDLEKTAVAETTNPFQLTPLLEKASQDKAPTDSDAAEAEKASPGETEETPSLFASNPLAEPKPAEKIYSDARYLAAFLAIGRYQGLPGAQEIYENLLSALSIDFTAYATIQDEIEAVTAALNEHPDIWQETAATLEAANILPAASSSD